MPAVWGFDTQSFQPNLSVRKRYQGIVGKVEFGLFPKWVNSGWEIQSVQPPRRPSIRQRYAGTKGKIGFAIFKTVKITGTVTDSVGGTAHYSITVTSV